MEASSSVVVDSHLRKRKAESEPEDEEEEEEESDGEIEEGRDERDKIEGREAAKALLVEPEWDVDSFDGLEYYFSSDVEFASDEEPYSGQALKHYRIYKRQIIESKGFKVDLELRPYRGYKGIAPDKIERKLPNGKTYGEFCEEMVCLCLQKHNQDKVSNVEFVELVRGYYRGGPRAKLYITFMAREKPDGPLVEYQAKGMVTVDQKKHPILCRPAPTP